MSAPRARRRHRRTAAGATAAVLALALAPAAPRAGAQVVELAAARDNSLFESIPPADPSSAEDNPSNGAGDFLFAGRTAPNNDGLIRRGLIAFDLAGALPADATVTGVSLRLYLSQTRTDPTFVTADVALHRALQDWGEGASDASGQEGGGADAQPGDATWIHTAFDPAGAGPTWQQPGGDFEPVASAVTPVGDRDLFYTWGGEGLVADVNRWIDHPEENFGWLIRGDESVVTTAKRFDSRERFFFDFETGLRTAPVLTVEFTTVPEPAAAAAALAAAALGLALSARSRRRPNLDAAR